jgi:hypothetical protein
VTVIQTRQAIYNKMRGLGCYLTQEGSQRDHLASGSHWPPWPRVAAGAARPPATGGVSRTKGRRTSTGVDGQRRREGRPVPSADSGRRPPGSLGFIARDGAREGWRLFFCAVSIGARDSIKRPLLYRLRFMCG